MSFTIKEFEELLYLLEENAKANKNFENQKQQKIENNLKQLRKKAKELNEEVPNTVLAVIIGNIPVGSWFTKRYEKWLN